ncbi:SGNH/GDSL hydrolase family protein [Rufibacter glacialis]|uniref:SGNH/GDSL hydrolase family protein n=1 Tax=Rufibacter glacialis TaxID=1259555 RepID=A0A5M8Q8V0_9BACT|nr:SGNH/GDSL hydrolase family protein [Rufibacter glacialis]KAA6431002.1 SGNH/GDSL hydrolase family protein [Rufibacter glacialis]GGK83219.1 acetylxylan esterase [Rufibacter glacialis]
MRLSALLRLPAFVAVLLWTIGCVPQKSVSVAPQDKQVAYMGRVGKPSQETAELYWSGTSVKLNFEGTGVKARLKDSSGKSYYNVIIDGDSLSILQPDTTSKLYTLATRLAPGKHTVELFKRTEWDKGTTTFYGFELENGGKTLPAAAPKTRRMEFYGNSITAGYAVEDYSGKDSWAGTNTNHYVSYAALAARFFDADYTCVCKSGIGVTISWEPLIMPELYDRLNPSDPSSKWDFAQQKQPDVVVINLFQNDSWLVNQPNHAQFKRRFGTTKPSEEFLITAYQNFVKSIRAKYPHAHIVAMLGNMDITRAGSPWPGYVEKAVAGLQDQKVYTLFAPYKDTPGHPRVEEQQALANQLIQFLQKKINW